MRVLTGLFFISILALSSCSNPEKEAADKKNADSLAKMALRGKSLDEIVKAEKQMKASPNGYDQTLAMASLKAYNDFIVRFPNDSLVPEYLFRASDLAQGAKNYQQATVYLETIIQKHKSYKKYCEANFMAAYLYDTYLEDVNHGGDRAKQLYQYVITNYPETKMAEDSRVLITHIGVPDDVWIDSLIKKGGK